MGSHKPEEHPHPPAHLARLDFLVGRLRGVGWLGNPDYRYTKEVSGSWAAGGHHLVLEMSADYPLGDGECDSHSVLLVVSAGPDPQSLICRAFTDGGRVIEYRPTATAHGLVFDDSVPHGCEAERARKLLRATPTGYEETLEVDHGDGEFVAWARIELEREAS